MATGRGEDGSGLGRDRCRLAKTGSGVRGARLARRDWRETGRTREIDRAAFAASVVG